MGNGSVRSKKVLLRDKECVWSEGTQIWICVILDICHIQNLSITLAPQLSRELEVSVSLIGNRYSGDGQIRCRTH